MSETNLQQRPAEVARWDPFEDLEQLQQQVAQVLPGWARMPGWSRANGAETEFSPVADLEETDDAYVVEIELAGVRKEDIKVELSGHRLSVTGERKEKERQGTLRRRTRTIGRFRYEIMLPGDTDDNNVDAHLDHGVLAIRIPKATAERPKQISIK